MLRPVAVLVTLAMLAGCPPTKLLEATTKYAAASETATEELAATADVVTSICHERAEVEYLTDTLARASAQSTFSVFYAQQPHALPGMPNSLTSTWKQQCDAYRIGDDLFAKYALAVGKYGVALGAFAADDPDAGTAFGALAKELGTAAGAVVPSAVPYKSKLADIGGPLGRVAGLVESRWKGKQLGTLVRKTDPDIQLVLTHLENYVNAVRTAEIRDARAALDALRAALQSIVVAGPGQPATALAVQQQLSASFIEVELGRRLDEAERRLESLTSLIEDLRRAHAALARGWADGEHAGSKTVKTITSLAKQISADVKSFENPMREAGS